MNSIFRILDSQLELNDCLESYGYDSFMKDEILEDEKGKYRIKQIEQERPCGCHPETCCHFSGKVWTTRTEKVYLKIKE